MWLIGSNQTNKFTNRSIIGVAKPVCMGKVVVRCPKCSSPIQVARPDSAHPFWSLSKPKPDVLEQVLECKNSSCASKFAVYWYDK
jgi:hypothetical protein